MITMFRGLLAVEVVVLVLLLQPNHWFNFGKRSNANQIQSKESCSRGRSKLVRTVLSQKFYPILEKYKKIQSLPLDCPFHPKREVLWWPDLVYSSDEDNLAKQRKRLFFYDYLSYLNTGDKWICPQCGLKLHSSEQLIAHFDDAHRNEFVEVPDDAICLADYCDIVRCDVLTGSEQKNKPNTNLVEPKCDKDRLNQLYDRCTRLIRQCTLGTLEFESSMNEFDRLENELSESMCSYLTCDMYYLQNGLNSSRSISIRFVILALLLIIALFSACYCFVWNLFESDHNLNGKLSTVFRAIKLANIVQIVYLVNVVRSKWLCKVVKKANVVSDVNNGNLDTEPIMQTKLPYKMKQSIFSVRSSSSDSIKKMQLEHLRNLELHEKRIRELVRLNPERRPQRIIIEEESQFEMQSERNQNFDQKNEDNQLRPSNLRIDDLTLKFNKKQFERPIVNGDEIGGTMISTKSKSEDKDSYYGSVLETDRESLFFEAESEFKKLSTNDSIKSTERKDRKPSEQSSISSYLTSSMGPPTQEPQNDGSRNSWETDRKSHGETAAGEERTDEENEQEETRRRKWNICGDITLLNAARMRLLEQRTTGKQLNSSKPDEHNQSTLLLCKKKATKSAIEMKEFKSTRKNPTVIPLEFDFQPNYDQPPYLIQPQKHLFSQNKIQNVSQKMSRYLPLSCSHSIDQPMDQTKESKRNLFKQSVASKKLVNPILNQVMFNHQQTRSQPSLSQTPLRPSSTNSHI